MSESDIILLIGYLHGLPQRVEPAPSTKRYDEYRAILTAAQRDLLVNALRSYQPQ